MQGRKPGALNKQWPENWQPILKATGGTLGKLAKELNVSATALARWRDRNNVPEARKAHLAEVALKYGVSSPMP